MHRETVIPPEQVRGRLNKAGMTSRNKCFTFLDTKFA